MSSNEQNIKSAIHDFLKNTRLSGKLAEQRIIDGWANLMGAMIAKHTQQIYIVKGKLYLHLSSAPLKQELFYAKEKLIKLLNEEAGEKVIEEIIFR